MFDIGYFFDDEESFRKAYFSHACGLVSAKIQNVRINDRMHQIIIDDYRHTYYLIRDNWKQRIQGLVFQGVFADVRHTSDRHYIMSRFRPRCKS